MKFEINANLQYTVAESATIILNVHALRTPRQAVIAEQFTINPYVKTEELISAHGENRFVRIEILESMDIEIAYKATVDNFCLETDLTNAQHTPVSWLSTSVFPYLFPSRYCQSDKLYRFANQMFGGIGNPYKQVIALTDWIHTNVEYLSGSSNSQTSAFDTVTELAGVCRDFAHVGIALCRALTIPARYFTGYAYQLQPPDFHALFEAYINGEWILFDATKLAPLNGIIKIATGRDAADTAVASLFGNINCKTISVSCEVVDENFIPFFYNAENMKGLSYV